MREIRLVGQGRRVWNFDPAYSTVEFVVRNFLYNVKGRFSVLEGSLVLDEDDIRHSSVTAIIKANSIDTGNKRRDVHLKSADFFDSEQFPDIEFKSTKVERGRDRDSLDVDGTLTVKGKAVPIALAVNEMDRSRSPNGEQFVYYSATAELDRMAYRLRTNTSEGDRHEVAQILDQGSNTLAGCVMYRIDHLESDGRTSWSAKSQRIPQHHEVGAHGRRTEASSRDSRQG
jgi:polyisoprenoid-binding protein YceI